MTKVYLIAFLCVFALAGCAVYTPPPKQVFDDSRVYSMDYDVVWEKALQWTVENEFVIDNIEKSSGYMKLTGKTINFSKYEIQTSGIAEMNQISVCGSGGIMNTKFVPIEMAMLVFVNKVENGTKVKAKVSFTKYKPDPARPDFSCVSNGAIEKSLFDYIQN